MKLTVVLAIIASILFAVACGGGKDADAPAVAVKAIAPTDTPEPTSTPNTVSSQSPTPPPISMVLETVSPELLSCVQTALGDEQYNAIISGRQDAVAEQLGLVLPCILQYPQEANAIMEMFGLDMGTIMAASPPIPNTPTLVPTATSVPTSFGWPNPPTGQRELMLSSTSGSAGDEVTAIGRGFVKIKAYAALWIDSNDNGLIDDGEHVIDWGNIETPRGEFTHTFTIDSNFQGTSSVNVQDGAGMSVNTAMNPTFTVSGTYATAVPATATVPIATAVPTPTRTRPTWTPVPIRTPWPTWTPVPAPTPVPTLAPTPTPVPLPLLEAFSRQIGCTGGIWGGPCYAFFWRLMNSSGETVTLKSASVRISSGNLLGEFTVDDGVIEPGGSYTFNNTFTAHIYTADDVNAFKTEWIIDTQSKGTIVCNLEPNYSVCKPY